ncbi:MAG: 30S ribosomal protein S3 [Fusobacteriota bacterium]
MGQKVNPTGIRLGITKSWDSNWYADDKQYADYFHEDLKIKKKIKADYYHAGIARMVIERTSPTKVVVIVHTAKPGIVIGRKGSEIKALKSELEELTGKKILIKVQEVKNPNNNAQLVAENIARAIENRISYKRAMNQAMRRAERSGAKGVKVAVSGRLNGAEMAREYWEASGRVPLHTLRADIDYAFTEANTKYGTIGVKVWLFHKEVLPTKKEGGKA